MYSRKFTMESMDYHQFLNIARYLSPEDIDNLAVVVRKFQPTRQLWTDLIFQRYHLLLKEASRADWLVLDSYQRPRSNYASIDQFYQDFLEKIYTFAEETINQKGYFLSRHHQVIIQARNCLYALLILEEYLRSKNLSYPLLGNLDREKIGQIESWLQLIADLCQLSSRIIQGDLKEAIGVTPSELIRTYIYLKRQREKLLRRLTGQVITDCYSSEWLQSVQSSQIDSLFLQEGDPPLLENIDINRVVFRIFLNANIRKFI